MKKVVVIGGGTGQSVILRALKNISDIELKTIVSMADDGGSTGRLQNIFNIPAVGDIRNVLIALSQDESLLAGLMAYRFDKSAQEFSGHNLGNLMLTALIDDSDDFLGAIYRLSRVLKIKGEVIPSTGFRIVMSAEMSDGSIIDGEHTIRENKGKIKRIFYKESVQANPLAIAAIQQADVIIYSIGSLYTSILPSLIIPDIKSALKQSPSQIIYFCNAMSEAGETTDYSLEDHVKALETHTERAVDYVIYGNDKIPAHILELYKSEEATVVNIAEDKHDYQIIETPLLDFEADLIRHDPKKVQAILERILL